MLNLIKITAQQAKKFSTTRSDAQYLVCLNRGDSTWWHTARFDTENSVFYEQDDVLPSDQILQIYRLPKNE